MHSIYLPAHQRHEEIMVIDESLGGFHAPIA